MVVDWEDELAAASACLREMRGDELDVENGEGEEEHLV